jgi:hypothetical protein
VSDGIPKREGRRERTPLSGDDANIPRRLEKKESLACRNVGYNAVKIVKNTTNSLSTPSPSPTAWEKGRNKESEFAPLPAGEGEATTERPAKPNVAKSRGGEGE